MKPTNNSIRSTALASTFAVTLLAAAITGCDKDSNQGISITAISADSGLSFLDPGRAQGPHTSPNLLLDFDDSPFYSSATYSFFRLGHQLSYATDLGHHNPGSMRVSNRTAIWQGPLFTLPPLQTKSLTASMWIKPVNTQRTAKAKLVLMQVSDSNSVSVPLAEMEVTPGKWQKLEGRIPSVESADKLHIIRLEVEGADIDYLVDDVSIKETASRSALEPEVGFEALAPTAPASGLIVNGDLENGVEPWSYQGGKITHTKEHAHSGKYSLLASGRTEGWHAPLMTLGQLEDNKLYRVSIYVRMTEEFPVADVQLTLKQVVDGQPKFIAVANRTASSDGWTQVVGTVESADFSVSEQLSIYLESATPTASYYVDTLTLEAL
jgi:endo-1,4-beta-xylanase